MLCVPSQPRAKCDLLSSLLEKNASEFAAQQEWEAEWNQLGLASRLSEEVREKGRHVLANALPETCGTFLL